MMAPYYNCSQDRNKIKTDGYTIENDKRVGIFLLEEPVTLADWEPDFISIFQRMANAAKKNIPY